ncbi:pyrimidine reductase family protein [Microbacterium sediminicola]|uniref:Pyrimidine reductase family protein n=1 Tax=Microbacterium sediminicola TaxID=415210 RepID=A0ABN2HT86_9MICO
MIVTEVVPRSLDAVDVDTAPDVTASWFAARYAQPADTVRINMITALTGAASGHDGTSESLTGGADRAILRAVRAAADVVLVGARSVRAEGYILPRRARLAVLTATGDLAGHRFRLPGDDSADAPLILCPASRFAAVRTQIGDLPVELAPLSTDAAPPAAALAHLRKMGLNRIVCEGGPSLASQLAQLDAVDEYCVSIAPALEPASSAFIAVTERVPTHLTGMLVDEDGYSYLRLTARR